MTFPQADNDRITVAAIGLLAMCVVTFDHEALGHGGMCVALGGHVRELTSTIFECDLRSRWIAPAGPLGNLLGGTVSMVVAHFVPRRFGGARLFVVLVTCFSFFWEAGYLLKAMVDRNGDLYFAGQDFLGEPSRWWRIAGAATALGLYAFTARWASRSLSELWSAAEARNVARIAWVSASAGATLAAAFHLGRGSADLTDAFMEIGAASLPLLFIPRRDQPSAGMPGSAIIGRGWNTIASSMIVFAVLVATLGRGMHF